MADQRGSADFGTPASMAGPSPPPAPTSSAWRSDRERYGTIHEEHFRYC